MSDFAKNMKQLRLARDMSQVQLAEQLNVTRQTVSNWERGLSHPDLDLLMALSEALGVEVNDLIYPQIRKRRGAPKTAPLSPKFILGSVFGYFILFIYGGASIGIPLFQKLVGGGIAEQRTLVLYWGLILLVGYIASCVCLITEYIVDAASGPESSDLGPLSGKDGPKQADSIEGDDR